MNERKFGDYGDYERRFGEPEGIEGSTARRRRARRYSEEESAPERYGSAERLEEKPREEAPSGEDLGGSRQQRRMGRHEAASIGSGIPGVRMSGSRPETPSEAPKREEPRPMVRHEARPEPKPETVRRPEVGEARREKQDRIEKKFFEKHKGFRNTLIGLGVAGILAIGIVGGSKFAAKEQPKENPDLKPEQKIEERYVEPVNTPAPIEEVAPVPTQEVYETIPVGTAEPELTYEEDDTYEEEEQGAEYLVVGSSYVENLGSIEMIEYHGGYIRENDPYYVDFDEKVTEDSFGAPLEGSTPVERVNSLTRRWVASPKAMVTMISHMNIESEMGLPEFTSLEHENDMADEIAGYDTERYDEFANKFLGIFYSKAKKAKLSRNCTMARDMMDMTGFPDEGEQDEVRLKSQLRGNNGALQITFYDENGRNIISDREAFRHELEALTPSERARAKDVVNLAWINIGEEEEGKEHGRGGNIEYKVGQVKLEELTPTPTPENTPTPTPENTPTPTPEVTPTPTPEVTPTPTPEVTPTPTPEVTPTPTPEVTPTPTPENTPTPTPEVTPTPTPEVTPTPTPENTPTPTPENTPTPTPENTPTPTPENTPTPTPENTPTPTPENTPTPTPENTPTPTPENTPTPTPTPEVTPTPKPEEPTPTPTDKPKDGDNQERITDEITDQNEGGGEMTTDSGADMSDQGETERPSRRGGWSYETTSGNATITDDAIVVQAPEEAVPSPAVLPEVNAEQPQNNEQAETPSGGEETSVGAEAIEQGPAVIPPEESSETGGGNEGAAGAEESGGGNEGGTEQAVEEGPAVIPPEENENPEPERTSVELTEEQENNELDELASLTGGGQ